MCRIVLMMFKYVNQDLQSVVTSLKSVCCFPFYGRVVIVFDLKF